jgi:hypothetical protein
MELVSRTSETPFEIETAKSLPKEIIVQIIEDYFAFRNTELRGWYSVLEERDHGSLITMKRMSPKNTGDNHQLNRSHDTVSIS